MHIRFLVQRSGLKEECLLLNFAPEPLNPGTLNLDPRTIEPGTFEPRTDLFSWAYFKEG
jgi:hypothetical protein